MGHLQLSALPPVFNYGLLLFQAPGAAGWAQISPVGFCPPLVFLADAPVLF